VGQGLRDRPKKLEKAGQEKGRRLDWPSLFYQLTLRFGWTPDQIRWLTFQELAHYLEEMRAAEKICPPAHISLSAIKAGLVGGGKKPAADKIPEGPVGPLPRFKITTSEKEAWLAAGMPPIERFLRQYRKEHKR
jgi:hypothetical protein